MTSFLDSAPIQARELRKSFGERRALDGISFDLGEQEVLGYVGPNGAGKTTTLRILMGTEPSFGGELIIRGQRVTAQRKALYAEMGYLPQSVAFAPWRTAAETLWLLGRLSGMDDSRLRLRVGEVLERVGLGAEACTRVGAFSGGMRQRLGLAQAWLHQPRLLILDEPFNHLDPAGRVHLKQLLLELNRAGAAILFSSHILTDVEELVHRLVVIHRGKAHFTGTASQLRQSHAGVAAVEVVTNLGGAQAARLVELAGVSVVREIAPGRLRVEFVPGAEVEGVTTSVVQWVLNAGGTIRGVLPQEPTLEEIIAKLGGAAET